MLEKLMTNFDEIWYDRHKVNFVHLF